VHEALVARGPNDEHPVVDEGGAKPPPPELLRGTAYRPLRCLGEGAMGAVWECEHLGLRKRVAVKLLHLDTVGAPGSAAAARADRLRLEAQATAQIGSPHVVEVTDFGTSADGQLFLVMERLVGRTLEEEVKRRGPLPVEEAVAIVVQMLRGLEAAHEVGMVHRDIKPSNVFYTAADRDGRRIAKLLDFGLVRVESDEIDLPPLAVPTLAGAVMGTPRYISPEQARGARAEARSDLYSAALVLYKLVTGRGPFDQQATSCELMLVAHAALRPEPPSSFAPAPLSPELDAIVLRALGKDPADRFPSAAAFAEALVRAPLRAPADRGLPLITDVIPEPSVVEGTRGGEAPTVALARGPARPPLAGVAPTLDWSGGSEAATERRVRPAAAAPGGRVPAAHPAPMAVAVDVGPAAHAPPMAVGAVAGPILGATDGVIGARKLGDHIAAFGIGLTVLAVVVLAIATSLLAC
jgi:serine/threonine protein kinase